MTLVLQSSAPHLRSPASYGGPFKDWGMIPTMIEGESRTSGIVLHKGPNGESETGIWICTPATGTATSRATSSATSFWAAAPTRMSPAK